MYFILEAINKRFLLVNFYINEIILTFLKHRNLYVFHQARNMQPLGGKTALKKKHTYFNTQFLSYEILFSEKLLDRERGFVRERERDRERECKRMMCDRCVCKGGMGVSDLTSEYIRPKFTFSFSFVLSLSLFPSLLNPNTRENKIV